MKAIEIGGVGPNSRLHLQYLESSTASMKLSHQRPCDAEFPHLGFKSSGSGKLVPLDLSAASAKNSVTPAGFEPWDYHQIRRLYLFGSKGIIKMKEIISIHLGDLGLNLAQTLWPLFQQETLDFDQTSITDSPFYSEYQSGSVKPRAILCDLDAQNMDYIRMQEGCIFDRDCMINHKDGSGGITVRGKYTTGKEIRDQVLECIRKQTEQLQQPRIWVYLNQNYLM